jgi:hypothetical protein
MILTYLDFANNTTSIKFITIYSYVRSFFYSIYPSIGYLAISFYIRKYKLSGEKGIIVRVKVFIRIG